MNSDGSAPPASSFTAEHYRPRIESFLNDIIRHGHFRLTYGIRGPEASADLLGSPEMLVEFDGPDAGLLLEAHAELLNAIEYIVLRALRLEEGLLPRIAFDCQGWRRSRVEELKLMAQVAADRVQETGDPFPLGAMNARERRIIHLALHERPEVRTESEGFGPERRVVIHPAASTPVRRR